MTLSKSKNIPANRSGFEITSSGVSHTGNVRERNEDSILLLEEEKLWLVADGMGGHQAGDFASKTITRNLELFKQQKSLEDSILLIEENLLNSNAIIRSKSSKMGKNATIGSTVVCAYIWQNYLFTFWAGDSRIYRFRKRKLDRLTDDHSYVEELVRMGKIAPQDAESHPAANVVLKAVGIDDELCLDFDYVEIEDNDIFVICSDGLYKDLEVSNMSSLINDNKNDMAVLTQSLLSHSLDAGGTDNTSIITIKANRR
ncbi:MAG: serine/threonine-protein phosphatase [Gammaproteobacteria bacterium]|nr:serine/threonine-protein phosphatase [Gammaproteobacteria bacterium]